MKVIKTIFSRGKPGAISNRHLLALKYYWSVKKLVNIALCETEKKLGLLKSMSMPYVATIDPTNTCNLRCPGCPTGLNIAGRNKCILDMKLLDKFLDEIGDYLMIANVYNWGESFLHPKIDEIIEKIHKKRIFSSISSNLNIRDFDKIKNVLDAGLDYLILSIDGATEETYSKYRVGGDFNLVLENIRKINEYKKQKNTWKPLLEWQLITFNHVESEIQKASALAKELKVDNFKLIGPVAPEKFQPASEELKGRFYAGSSFCAMLWHGITLQPDGGLSPCCNLFYKEDDFGNIANTTIKALRKSEKYIIARSLFTKNKWRNFSLANHPCITCPLVHRQPQFQHYLESHPHLKSREDFMGVNLKTDDYNKIYAQKE